MKKNILALDYGRKRWGVAFCDELRVVFALPAITQDSFKQRLESLMEIISKRAVTQLVVGLPLTLEGKKSKLTIEVEGFIENILKPLGVPITTVDEGLSSFEAESQIPKHKINKGFQKRDGTVDSKAAALMLEEYLAQKSP